MTAAVHTEMDGDEKDVEDLMQTAALFHQKGEPSPIAAAVKKEPVEEEPVVDPAVKKHNAIEAVPKAFLRKFQEMKMSLGEWEVQAQSRRFMDTFVSEAAKLTPKLKHW